jgi:hypothetical protein
MVDEDGFGPTPHQVKMKKKNQAYQDRHMEPIGENVEVMRHSETIRVEFRYFSTPVAGETRNPVPLLYELVKKMFSVAPSIMVKSVNNEKAYFSKIEGFLNGFEIEEFFKVVYNINAVNKTGKIYVYFKIFSMLGTRVDTLKQKPGFMTFLRDNNLFMNMHQYETYAISTVGHVFKRLPEATNCQDYKEMLEAKILRAQDDKAEMNPTLKLLITPLIKIEVQPARVIHLLRNQQGQVTEKGDTYALRVRCERDKVKEVSALLSSGICNDMFTGTFVPITAAVENPDGYMQLVDEHEEYRKTHSFIRINGLHPDLFQAQIFDSSDNTTKTMKDGIMAWKENGSNIVISTEPSLNVLENGEWRVIVKNSNTAIALEKLEKITIDAEKHDLFRARIHESESFQRGIIIISSKVVDNDTMSYMDTLTGKIDATVAANRRAQRISNTAPTASIYLFNDSMSAQGKSQVSSVTSRNAWHTPLTTATHNTTPSVRNIHQQQGGGLNTEHGGRTGGRGMSRENSEMSLTLQSDNETLQSQLTRVEQTIAGFNRLIMTQNAKLDKQSAEITSQKEEIALLRHEQATSNYNATTVGTLLDKLMMRMVDLEQGRIKIGTRIGMTDGAIANLPLPQTTRIQLSTPVQSPAKSLGLETPESYNRKRREAMEAAAEADRRERLAHGKEVDAARLATVTTIDGDTEMGTISDTVNEIVMTTVDDSMISRYDQDDDEFGEDNDAIAAQYNMHNEDDAKSDVSMTTPTTATNNGQNIAKQYPEDQGPSGTCG